MPTKKPTAKTQLTWKKKAAFAFICTSLFFCGVEFLLFLLGVSTITSKSDPSAGFSRQIPLLASSTNETGEVVLTTASNKESWFNVQSFLKEKPANTKRVFCVGGSTTFGRPFADSTSYVRWLRELLPEVDPANQWEVINAGGVSYASYRVAAVMRELAQYEPDLFIVYSAQNEFLERRTYARMFENQSWMNDLSAALQSTRTGSTVQRLTQALQRSNSSPEDGETKTLSKSSAPYPEEVDEMLNHSVGPLHYHRNAEWRKEVIFEYQYNLEDMISIARNAGAEIVFVSPVSNLRGTSPFKSLFDEGTDEKSLTEVLQTARTHLRSGQLDEAHSLAREVTEASPKSADAQYLLGQILFARAEWNEAEEAFARALEEDICPLRAIKPLRDALRSVCERADVTLVEAEDLLRRTSIDQKGHACLGDDYFLDHVHPTLEVHRLLGKWIVDELLANSLIAGQAPSQASMDAIQDKVSASIDDLETSIAFRNLAKVNHWAGKFAEAIVAARRSLFIAPDDLESRFLLADSLNNLEQYEEARSEYQILFDIEDYARAHLPYGELLLNSGLVEQAEPYLIAALLTDNEEHMARAYYDLGLLYSATGQYELGVSTLENVIEAYPDDSATIVLMAFCLRNAERPADAAELLDKFLQQEPNHARGNFEAAEAHLALGNLQKAQNHIKVAVAAEPDNAEFKATLNRLEQTAPAAP